MQKGKYFKFILKSCGQPVYREFISISIQKAIISFFELVGLAGLFSIITILLNEATLENYRTKIESIIGLNLSTTQFVVFSLLGTIAFFTIKNLVANHLDIKSLKFIEKLIKTLNEKIIRNFFEKGYWHFNNEKMFDLTHKASALPNEFGFFSLRSAWQITSEAFLIFFFLILAFSTSFAFSSVLIIMSIPVSFIAYKRINNQAKVAGNERMKQQPKTARELYDLFTGFIEMKIYSSSDQFLNLYLLSLEKLNMLKAKENKLALMPKRILELLAVVVVTLTYLLHLAGNELGFNSNLMLDVSLLGLFGYKVLPGVARIIESLVQLGNSEKVRLTLYQNLEKTQATSPTPIGAFESLELKDLNFSYGERKILDSFNFSLKKGEIIGIMGQSGTGKSTMAKVILGLIKADSGLTEINGSSTNIYLNDSWQKKFGYIGPESFMMDGSIYENIAFSKKEINTTKIHSLLDLCQLSEYKKNDILIGEMGNKLSSGLKQRIAFARALYHDPEILILDEFSSNLDYKNEDELLSLIKELVTEKKMAVLIISHRTRSMSIASKVLELENGRLKIIEQP